MRSAAGYPATILTVVLVTACGDGSASSSAQTAKGTVPASAPTVTSYSLPSLTGEGVAIDSTALWLPADEAGALLRVDPATGKVVATINIGTPGPPDGTPAGVVSGSLGVWVADSSGMAVVRIDPATNTAADRVPIGVHPTMLAEQDGAVWVTARTDDEIVRIDATTGRVVATIRTDHNPFYIVAADGALWVSTLGGEVLRIDPTSNTIAARISVGTRPRVIVGDADGVWVADSGRANSGTVSRIDPATNTVTAIIPVTFANALALGEGSVWATSTSSVVQIAVNGSRVVRTVSLPPGSAAGSVALGAGRVYVGDGLEPVLYEFSATP